MSLKGKRLTKKVLIQRKPGYPDSPVEKRFKSNPYCSRRTRPILSQEVSNLFSISLANLHQHLLCPDSVLASTRPETFMLGGLFKEATSAEGLVLYASEPAMVGKAGYKLNK